MIGLNVSNNNNDFVRIYFAITNFCNRACELCSCHSDPTKNTFLCFDDFKKTIKDKSNGKYYESQIEGGEPTIAPDFWKMVNYNLDDNFCNKIILCTNAVKIPFSHNQEQSIEKIEKWILKFSKKTFILKPSINSHLINHSKVHMKKCYHIMIAWNNLIEKKLLKEGSQLIFNVRIIPKPITNDGEQWIIDQINNYNLQNFCNIFEYQKYGKAENEDFLKEPFIVKNPVKFFLISPDNKNFNDNLIDRANHMKNMD